MRIDVNNHIILIAFYAFLFFPLISYAQNPRTVDEINMDIKQKETEIKEIELWAQMKDAANFIPEKSRCKTYLEMAKGYHDELKELNQHYQGKANQNYRQRAEILLDGNKRAVQEYQSCFSSLAQQYDKIVSERIYPYPLFKGRYNILSDKYGNINTGQRWSELTRELDELIEEKHDAEEKNDHHAGEVTNTFRMVKLKRGSREFDLKKGDYVFVGDEIITGPRGRTRIEVNDFCQKTGAGPTVLNVGSSSHIVMTSFKREACDQPNTLIDLVRGVIRAFTQGFGGREAFSVRVGTSLCGIRGTEITIRHDPAMSRSSVWLDHGNAFLKTTEGIQDLQAGTVSRVEFNHLVKQDFFTKTEYEALIMETAEQADMGLNEALKNRSDLQNRIQKNNPNKNRQVTEYYAMASLEVRQTLNTLLHSYGRRDWDFIISHLRDDWGKNLEQELNTAEGRVRAETSGRLPQKWNIDCISCRSLSNCEAYLRLRLDGSPHEEKRYLYKFIEKSRKNWILVDSIRPEQTAYQQGVNACILQ